MHEYDLTVNGRRVKVKAASDTPLLWILRDDLGLAGTKFGCGCRTPLNGKWRLRRP